MAYTGKGNIRTYIFAIAAIKTRYKVSWRMISLTLASLPVSTRISHLMPPRSFSCKRIRLCSIFLTQRKQLQCAISRQRSKPCSLSYPAPRTALLEVPDVQECLKTENVPPYVYTKVYEEVREPPFVVYEEHALNSLCFLIRPCSDLRGRYTQLREQQQNQSLLLELMKRWHVMRAFKRRRDFKGEGQSSQRVLKSVDIGWLSFK